MAQPPNKHSHPMVKTADHSGQPYTGPLTVDATACGPFLVDVPPGGTRGLQHTKPGLDAVLAELSASMGPYGAGAGVPPAAWQAAQDATGKLAKLAPIAALAAKLAEVCTETAVLLENAREHAIGQIANAVESTARHTKAPALKAPFEKTLAYARQTADKAVARRRANQAAKAAKPAAAAK